MTDASGFLEVTSPNADAKGGNEGNTITRNTSNHTSNLDSGLSVKVANTSDMIFHNDPICPAVLNEFTRSNFN